MTTQRERLEQAMEKHFGPQRFGELAGAQRLQQYVLASEGPARERIVRYMKNDALDQCERMAAVCVTAGLVTVPDGADD